MNNQVSYLFFLFQIYLLIFQSPYEFFQFFVDVYKNTVFNKNLGYNRATVNSIIWKIFMCDIESCSKNMSKIRNVTLIFQNNKKIKNVKKLKFFLWILKNE